MKNPPIKKLVLIAIEEAGAEGLPACVVLGYFKVYSEGSYYRVHPGANIGVNRATTHWCDCLPDKFTTPTWPGTPF